MRKVDIGWMRVFVEAARAGSLSEAAQRLHITQPAVSYQIRRAEAEFGCALLRRRSRGVELTEEGRMVFDLLSRSVAQIDDLAARLRPATPGKVLRLFTDYAFSSLWLMPRMHRLRTAFPDCDLQIIASQQTDLGQLADGDMAVVFRTRADFDDGAMLLMPETVVPVCAPDLCEGAAPGALQGARLIHLDSPQRAPWFDWRDYLAAFGAAQEGRARRGDLNFNTYSLVIEAAQAGQGVALGWRGLIERLLQRGDLIEAGPELRAQDRGYFLMQRGTRQGQGAALCDWLVAESRSEIIQT